MVEGWSETINIADKAGRRSLSPIIDGICPAVVCLARTRVSNPDSWLNALPRVL